MIAWGFGPQELLVMAIFGLLIFGKRIHSPRALAPPTAAPDVNRFLIAIGILVILLQTLWIASRLSGQR